MARAETALRYLKGVGPRRAEKLADLGLETHEDLLYQLPFRYEDRRVLATIADLLPGAPACTLSVEVASAKLIRTRKRGFTIFDALLRDESGNITGRWYNQPYLERVLVPGRRVPRRSESPAHRKRGW